MNSLRKLLLTAAGGLLLPGSVAAQPQPLTLRCDPAQTSAKFTLSATLHSVHGDFKLRRCEVQFDPATGKISGEIVFDAGSGKTANDGRDKKMHKDVLESGRYPDIAFRPDRVAGTVSENATSTVQVHGMFGVHGAEHELTIPVEVKLEGDHWSANARFPVPYAQWGMKNPSNLFLHVGNSVDAEFSGGGSIVAPVPQ